MALPGVVSSQRALGRFSRSKSQLSAEVRFSLSNKRLHQAQCAQRKRNVTRRSIGLRGVDVAPIKPPPNLYAAFREIEIADLQRKDFSRAHAFDRRKPKMIFSRKSKALITILKSSVVRTLLSRPGRQLFGV